jgi:ribokinase
VADLHLNTVDVLIPNEWEARELAGRRGDEKYSVRDVAMLLSSMGASAVCVTRAHNGCCFVRRDTKTYREYEAYEADVDDTTGASDAFCAALALHIRAGYETEEAIHQAQAAGAFAVRRQGAGRHMPTKGELDVHRSWLESTRGG